MGWALTGQHLTEEPFLHGQLDVSLVEASLEGDGAERAFQAPGLLRALLCWELCSGDNSSQWLCCWHCARHPFTCVQVHPATPQPQRLKTAHHSHPRIPAVCRRPASFLEEETLDLQWFS